LFNTARAALELLAAGERELPILGEPEVGWSWSPWRALFAAKARRTDLTFATGATGA
jgi:hypothetical protein